MSSFGVVTFPVTNTHWAYMLHQKRHPGKYMISNLNFPSYLLSSCHSCASQSFHFQFHIPPGSMDCPQNLGHILPRETAAPIDHSSSSSPKTSSISISYW